MKLKGRCWPSGAKSMSMIKAERSQREIFSRLMMTLPLHHQALKSINFKYWRVSQKKSQSQSCQSYSKIQNKQNHTHPNTSEMKLKPFPETIVVHQWKEKGFSIGIQLRKTAWSFVGWWFELGWEIGQNRGQIKKRTSIFS